jgi:hypothetical protein
VLSSRNYTVSKSGIPSRFKNSRKQKQGRANRAFRRGGPAYKLAKSHKQTCLYTLHYHHLGLPKAFARASMIYDRHALKIWRDVLKKHFKKPYFYRFEVGRDGRLHVHVLADIDAGLLWLPRSGKVVKPIQKGTLIKVLIYLSKPPVPLSGQALKEYEEGCEEALRINKSLPRVSGYVGVRCL